MHSNITLKIKELNYNWLDSIETDVSKRLGKTLCCRSMSHPGLLECNIDRSILDIFDEVNAFPFARLNCCILCIVTHPFRRLNILKYYGFQCRFI